jgi:hypothetical protein
VYPEPVVEVSLLRLVPLLVPLLVPPVPTKGAYPDESGTLPPLLDPEDDDVEVLLVDVELCIFL